MSRLAVLAALAALVASGSASADELHPAAAPAEQAPGRIAADLARGIDYVVVEPSPPVFHAAPEVLYLNRCVGGCSASAGRDDAVADRSSILGRDGTPSSISLSPFMHDDATWDGMVACVRATYAIYGVSVVTEPPAGAHVEVMVAGSAAALGLPGNTLGIAPLANDCSALGSAIAFAFANAHQTGPELVAELCATTAHEAGHVYGLDHEFECKDPRTYLTGCGVKVFLNRTVECGEFDAPRTCKCAAKQSSHLKLYDELGPGAPPGSPPITIRSPQPGATVSSTFSVFVEVDGRPATTVELWINGAPISSLPGKLVDAPYELVTPSSLFDGALDLEVRVYDDLGTLGTAAITVFKGAPCVSADTCPAGYSCGDGRCVAPPGEAQVGDDCAGSAECASKECVARGGEATCTQPCWPATGGCPAGLSCIQADDERFGCFVSDAGGCCSTTSDPRGSLVLSAIILLCLRARARARARSSHGI